MPGMFGDLPIDLVNEMIKGGAVLGDPNDPVVTITPEGRGLTARDLADLGAQAGIGHAGGAPASFDPDAFINGMEADYESAVNEIETGTGRYAPPEPPPDPREQQFGNDMAWLDPLFQQDPTEAITTAQQFGRTADPLAEEGQLALLGNITSRGRTADTETEGDQRALAAQIGQRGTTADPTSEAGQRALAERIGQRGTTADAASEGTQRDVMAELLGIYQQGGNTARDKMLRAKARADVEGWLKGQREADMADLAERGGMGSGAEVATMLGDRQAAATRLSGADLQASADSEQRALDALMGGGELATRMRGQADTYEGQNTDALRAVLNDSRTAADAYEGRNTDALSELLSGMRTASDDFLGENTRAASGILDSMRSSSDAYQQNNARMIADIGNTNKNFLRDAQQKMLDRRTEWDMNAFNQQIDVATGQRDFDQEENRAGFDYGYGTAEADSRAFNTAQGNANAGQMGAFTGMTPGVQGATNTRINATGGTQAAAGASVSGGANFVGNLIGGLFGGGKGGNSSGGDDDDRKVA